MRIVVAAALLIAAASLPAGAESTRPARLAGITTVSGVGAVAVALQADTFGLLPGTAGVALSTNGKSMALLLVRQGRDVSRQFQNLSVDVLSKRPDGCSDEGPCARPQGFLGSFREGAASSAPWSEAHFSGGRYVAYLVGEPGKRVTATIRAQGLSGRSVVRATTPVRARLTGRRISQPMLAQLDGAQTFRTLGPAGAFQFLWTADSGAVPVYNHQMKLCLDRAGEGASPAPDQACFVDARPTLLGGSSQGGGGCFGQALTQAPGRTEPGSCASLFPLLPRDVYLSRWSAFRAGGSPAVGYLGVVVEYLRT